MKVLSLSLVLGFVLVSTNLFAREAVISSYELTSAPSEKNKDMAAFHIEGFAEAKDEGCEATRAEAKLVLSTKDGIPSLSVEVSPRFIARRLPCAAKPEGFQGLAFSADFELTKDEAAKAVIKNIKGLASVSLLSSLSPDEEKGDGTQLTGCESISYVDTLCTAEYKPTTCRYGAFKVSAGNPCVARGKIQQKICASEGLFASEELTCISGEEI